MSSPDESKHPENKLEVRITGEPLKVEVDTGATFSVDGEATFEQLRKGKVSWEHSDVVLQVYGGTQKKVKGKLTVPVKYQESTCKDMLLLVVPGDCSALLGRNWLASIRLDWHNIFRLQNCRTPKLNQMLVNHSAVFDGQMGCIKDSRQT